MRRGLVCLLAVGFLLAARDACADEAPPPITIDGSAEYVIQPSRYDGLLRLMIWAPKGTPPAGGYPVIYAFDADMYFGYLSNAASGLQFKARWTGRDPAILVGIGYPKGTFNLAQRNYDLTPPSESYRLPERPNGKPWSKMGGGERFLEALVKDIKPFVAARYAVDEARETLFGHSFGGMMVLHALFIRPAAFDRYVAASPSIWFNDKAVLQKAEMFVKSDVSTPDGPIPLKILVGGEEQTFTNWERNGRTGMDKREAWFAETRMIDNARELVDWLRSAAPRKVAVEFEIIAGAGHGGVVPPAAYQGIQFALEK